MKNLFFTALILISYSGSVSQILSKNQYPNNFLYYSNSSVDQNLKSMMNVVDDTSKKPSNWKNDLTARLTLTQIGFTNWVKGGENSFAWVSMIDGKLLYRDTTFDWRTNHRFSYGETKQGSNDFRKNEDLIDISSVLSLLAGWAVDPYFSMTLRTQFRHGYTYKGDTATVTSNFFDPGYTTQNFGFQYAPKWKDIIFRVRVGLSLKETFSRDFVNVTDDIATPEIEKVKFQVGSELVTDYQQQFNSILSVKSKFELFTDYKRIDGTDIRWDNLVTIQVFKYIAISINAVMYYNIDESKQVQWKEVLGVGLFYDFK